MAGPLHTLSGRVPLISSWVLAIDGHAFNVPCCHAIELQAAHSVTRAKFRQPVRALGVWSDGVGCGQ